ncbi:MULTISPECIES: hypothetical protein [Mammaliicoccus]|uniref:Uncharacterized protein n=2 Tax=Mammaliicoccus vitulinus TaxID=71237 RepID=A0A2T4PR13_9STAP|nr:MULTISPECIES: hypothetical protein [Mammaliicoccus]HAL09695.1 hypothetical protein [Staphylococcus sp.]PNZ40221.1 hypothetical protein CD107_03400 [Mammaliicoccus vitulinus]PTI28358.1 hypothetical protein BU072_11830 [Mammaliicoccus vitulinus]PTI68526.1 hypothetical protein BU073_13040 [Mammaliicoccus vitulinus]QRO85458.1 hypothetical protein I6J37_01775 [Mammaliicoccus vitulinus]
MKKVIMFILSLFSLLYVLNLFYNALFNDKPLNPVTTTILIGVVIGVVYILISDYLKKKQEKE